MPIPRHGASVGDPAENLAECRVSAFGGYNALMLEETAPAINPVPILNAVERKEKRIGFDSMASAAARSPATMSKTIATVLSLISMTKRTRCGLIATRLPLPLSVRKKGRISSVCDLDDNSRSHNESLDCFGRFGNRQGAAAVPARSPSFAPDRQPCRKRWPTGGTFSAPEAIIPAQRADAVMRGEHLCLPSPLSALKPLVCGLAREGRG
jgi:hypothetical protein